MGRNKTSSMDSQGKRRSKRLLFTIIQFVIFLTCMQLKFRFVYFVHKLQETAIIDESAATNNTPPHSNITPAIMGIDGDTFDITQMSCSQLLHQMMATETTTWGPSEELSMLMMDAPIQSYASLLRAPEGFEVSRKKFIKMHLYCRTRKMCNRFANAFHIKIEQHDNNDKQDRQSIK